MSGTSLVLLALNSVFVVLGPTGRTLDADTFFSVAVLSTAAAAFALAALCDTPAPPDPSRSPLALERRPPRLRRRFTGPRERRV